MAWAGSPMPIEIAPATPANLTAAEVTGAVTAAALAWDRSQNACTALAVRAQAAPNAPRGVGMDGRNVLAFVTDTWCNPAALTPDGKTCLDRNYSRGALALTTVFAYVQSGRVLEADLEINAVHHQWAVSPQPGLHDIQNAVTHEIGHLLGFDHTCALAGEPAGLADDKGRPRGSCDRATPEQLEATMFPSSTLGDTARRTLSPDDTRALCDVYPRADEEGGCAVPGQGSPGPGLPVLLVMVTLLGLRGRRRARR